MARTCTICTRLRRRDIDAVLVAGTSYRDIAGRFGLSKTAVERHQQDHVPKLLRDAKDATDLADANRLLAEVQDLHRRTLDILDQPEGQDTALRAIREARGNLELFIKLRATLEPTDDLEELTTALLDVLQAHPEAHGDIVRVLERFEQSD